MWSETLSQTSEGPVWTLFLIDILVKATVVLLLGSTIAWMMRRQSASARHLVWTFSIVSCLFIPVSMLAMPGWGIERALAPAPASVQPAPATAASSANSDFAGAQLDAAASDMDVVDQSDAHRSTSQEHAPPVQAEPVSLIRNEQAITNSLPHWLFASWLAGFLMAILPLFAGACRVALLRRRSRPLRGEGWRQLADEVADSLRYPWSVTLFKSRGLDVPLCGGIVRPFVILPDNCAQWTPERRRLVLLHEIAHVSRNDVPVQWLCRLVCAVYWFHPLVWIAARCMKVEQERACDDLVLTAGTATATVYAEHLVAIAADCRKGRRHAVAAAAFVRHGELEARIRCILQTDRQRRPLSTPLQAALLVLLTGGMVSIATAGKVTVRNREGEVVVTVPVPKGGTVTIEEQAEEPPTDGGQTAEVFLSKEEVDLGKRIDAAIEASSKRYLDAKWHTPYQVMRLLVPFGRESRVRLDGSFVNTIEYASGGPAYNGQPWFEKTPHGGRAHPFTEPYAFEGHPNQFAAYLSAVDLPLKHEIQTPDGVITISDLVEHAQATVGDRATDQSENGADSEWTLWFLTKYLPQDAEWTDRNGRSWSMEELVRIQVDAPVSRAPSGGRPQLYSLTLARNARIEQTGKLDGVWLEADRKIQQHVELAVFHQDSDGSFPTRVFSISNYNRHRLADDDWNRRLQATGSILAWLCIALPEDQLNADWIRDAARYVATELEQRRRDPIDVAALADGLHGLVEYRRHAHTEDPTDQ